MNKILTIFCRGECASSANPTFWLFAPYSKILDPLITRAKNKFFLKKKVVSIIGF